MVLLIVLLFAILPAKEVAAQQFTIAVMLNQSPNATGTVMAGAGISPIRVGRLSAGPAILAGSAWDEQDHAHFIWMPAAQANFRIVKGVGATLGYGWARVPKSAQTFLSNYTTWYLGVSFGR